LRLLNLLLFPIGSIAPLLWLFNGFFIGQLILFLRHFLDLRDLKPLALSLIHPCGFLFPRLGAIRGAIVLDQGWVLGTLLLDVGVLQDCVAVLKGVVTLRRRGGVDANGHVQLQDGEKSHGEPKRNSDSVIFVGDVVDSKAV